MAGRGSSFIAATMKAVVLLIAASACSAQLLLPYSAPWALPSAELLTTPQMTGEVRPLILSNPLVNPYINPAQFTIMMREPKAEDGSEKTRSRREVALPVSYVTKTTVETKQLEPVAAPTPADTTKLQLTTKEHEFAVPTVGYAQPFVDYRPVRYGALPIIGALRTRRDVRLPLPYVHAVPAVAKTTIETRQFEPIEADTPADTTKLQLTTQEREVAIPAVRYTQPIVNYNPVQYTAPISMPFPVAA